MDRNYPQSFPDYLLKNIKLLTFSEDTPPKPVGSYTYTSQKYSADVDLVEEFKTCCTIDDVVKNFSNRIKTIIKTISKYESPYISDIKIGEDQRFDVNVGKFNNGYVKFNNDEVINKTNELYKNKLIDRETKNEIMKNIKLYYDKKLSYYVEAIEEIFRNLKVIRWTSKEIIQGYKKLVGDVNITIEEAAKIKSVIKIDLIALVNNKYTEITNVLLLIAELKNGKNIMINFEETNITDELSKDIEKMLFSQYFYNPFKGLKRMYSLARELKDKTMLNRLENMVTGNISLLYQIKSEIEAIILLLEKFKPPITNINNQLQDMKARLINVTELNKYQNLTDEYINKATEEKDIEKKIKLLDGIKTFLKYFINKYSSDFIVNNEFDKLEYPYLPTFKKYKRQYLPFDIDIHNNKMLHKLYNMKGGIIKRGTIKRKKRVRFFNNNTTDALRNKQLEREMRLTQKALDKEYIYRRLGQKMGGCNHDNCTCDMDYGYGYSYGGDINGTYLVGDYLGKMRTMGGAREPQNENYFLDGLTDIETANKRVIQGIVNNQSYKTEDDLILEKFERFKRLEQEVLDKEFRDKLIAERLTKGITKPLIFGPLTKIQQDFLEGKVPYGYLSPHDIKRFDQIIAERLVDKHGYVPGDIDVVKKDLADLYNQFGADLVDNYIQNQYIIPAEEKYKNAIIAEDLAVRRLREYAEFDDSEYDIRKKELENATKTRKILEEKYKFKPPYKSLYKPLSKSKRDRDNLVSSSSSLGDLLDNVDLANVYESDDSSIKEKKPKKKLSKTQLTYEQLKKEVKKISTEELKNMRDQLDELEEISMDNNQNIDYEKMDLLDYEKMYDKQLERESKMEGKFKNEDEKIYEKIYDEQQEREREMEREREEEAKIYYEEKRKHEAEEIRKKKAEEIKQEIIEEEILKKLNTEYETHIENNQLDQMATDLIKGYFDIFNLKTKIEDPRDYDRLFDVVYQKNAKFRNYVKDNNLFQEGSLDIFNEYKNFLAKQNKPNLAKIVGQYKSKYQPKPKPVPVKTPAKKVAKKGSKTKNK